MDCALNPADFQAAGEAIVSLVIWGMVGATAMGYLLADPLAPLRLCAVVARFIRLARR